MNRSDRIDVIRKRLATKRAATPQCLAGTALKRLLRWFGITLTKGCQCRARASQLDRWGCDECERRIEQIVGWLREEAAKRRLPFANWAGRLLVRIAIRNARRAR